MFSKRKRFSLNQEMKEIYRTLFFACADGMMKGLFYLCSVMLHIWAYAPIHNIFAQRKLSFPPVVFDLMRDYLSQHPYKGSPNLQVEFMPELLGTNKSCVRAPTWFTRFNQTASPGISRGGFFHHPLNLLLAFQPLESTLVSN